MIEFVEDTHTYLYDGVIIPSVSEIIRFKFPDAYKGVPDWVLKRKATYGTLIHQRIEEFASGELALEEIADPEAREKVKEFEALRKKWCFYIKDIEKIVDYEGRVAGRYDILLEDDILVDIKTTSKIHEDWLAWQLGFYYLALGVKKDYGFCMWFPKGKEAEVKKIDVMSHEDCVKLLEEYEKSNSPE